MDRCRTVRLPGLSTQRVAVLGAVPIGTTRPAPSLATVCRPYETPPKRRPETQNLTSEAICCHQTPANPPNSGCALRGEAQTIYNLQAPEESWRSFLVAYEAERQPPKPND